MCSVINITVDRFDSKCSKAGRYHILSHCLKQSVWSTNKESLVESTVAHAHYAAHKTRCTFLKSTDRDLFGAIDIAKVSDVLLFVVDCSGGAVGLIDEVSECVVI